MLDDSQGSQPIAPPVEAAPITAEQAVPVTEQATTPVVSEPAQETPQVPTSGETPAPL